MPIITPEQLSELQDQIRLAVADADLETAFHLLEGALPAGRPKANQVTLLNGRANDIIDFDINNTLSTDQLAILRNELRLDLLTFVDHLTLHDFSTEASTSRPELKPGHLLYQVPPKMAVRETHRCLVRIAHLLNQVLEGLPFDDSISLEEIPVSEVMEVEILDPCPSGNRAFDILLLSDGEQVVDEFMATEWVFNVRPLREGQHDLILKISVLITVGEKERTKNIVLSRPITVAAELAEEVEPPLIRVMDAPQIVAEEMMVLEPSVESSYSAPPPPIVAPAPSASPLPAPEIILANDGGSRVDHAPPPAPAPKRESGRKQYGGWMSAAVLALVLVVATFLFLPSEGTDTTTTVAIEEPVVAPPVKEDQLALDEAKEDAPQEPKRTTSTQPTEDARENDLTSPEVKTTRPVRENADRQAMKDNNQTVATSTASSNDRWIAGREGIIARTVQLRQIPLELRTPTYVDSVVRARMPFKLKLENVERKKLTDGSVAITYSYISDTEGRLILRDTIR
ncbi:hypothetical protein [Neolewinella agarilytica]|uniref:hypothetical protein n=1 Tax=Neolewinella agarilytica TaxID=478744 RepID=UPI0023579AA1|nr:hypothetical protein [Neolewinella agarilytica]